MPQGDPFTEADDGWPHGVRTGAAATRHQLNNDLGLVVGYAELLLHDPELPPHLRGHVAEILRGAEAAQTVLSRLGDGTGADLSN